MQALRPILAANKPFLSHPCEQAQLHYRGVPITAINFLNFDSKLDWLSKKIFGSAYLDGIFCS